eukprot:12471283-Alexandrium_andersonii.AAC.1
MPPRFLAGRLARVASTRAPARRGIWNSPARLISSPYSASNWRQVGAWPSSKRWKTGDHARWSSEWSSSVSAATLSFSTK